MIVKQNVLKPLRAACGTGPSMNRMLREQMASSVPHAPLGLCIAAKRERS